MTVKDILQNAVTRRLDVHLAADKPLFRIDGELTFTDCRRCRLRSSGNALQILSRSRLRF